MRLEGQTKLAYNVFVEVEKLLTQETLKSNELITLGEILEVLKVNPKLLWYYAIPNNNGLFMLQGKNRLQVPYLNLGIEHPCVNQQNLLFEFHFDLTGKGMSFQTNNDFLRTKIYELLTTLSIDRYYDPRNIKERKILEPIVFQNVYFSEEIKRELKNKIIRK